MLSKTFLVAVITLLPLVPILLLFWSTNPNNIRLPTHIWPQAYNITIQPFLEDKDADVRYNFSGHVQIRIKSLITTKYLVMHSRNLTYSAIEYWAEDVPSQKIKIEKMRFDFNTERIIFQLGHNLAPNNSYILSFKYTGTVQESSYGIFLKEYKDANNLTRRFLATQFQPNEARAAFPCFDEPQFKATFQISLVRPKHMKSYSNTRRTCSYMKGGLFFDTFHVTPVMSSYTVAFLIAPFKQRTIGGFSIIAKPEKFNQTKLCLELGSKVLIALENYFNMSYYDMGIDKLSIVALPDVNFGAMENWGLVVYSENSALSDENETSLLKKQDMIRLLGHELSHMWFGNLVTCEWWTSLWLNEGFALYFSYFILDMLEGNYTSSKDAYVASMRNCLKNDVSDLTYAINFERKQVSRAYFNHITYEKGASILYMIKHTVGEKKFQIFIRKYLQVYKYKHVTAKSLQNVLLEYWPANFVHYFDGFFKSFIEQAGFPLITIHFLSNGSYFDVSQECFPASQHEEAESCPTFTVPISFTTNIESNFSRTSPNFFLSTKKKRYELISTLPAKWLIANIQATWYYRVNYNNENWLHIAEALHEFNFSGIPLLNRMQIVDDIQHLFCIEKINSDLALKVLGYLSNEIHYLPWNFALKHLEAILRYSKWNRNTIIAFMREISFKVYRNLGFLEKPYDNLLTLKNRDQIVPLACKYGNTVCLNEARYYFENREKLFSLSSYLRLVVYSTLVREKNESFYEEMFNLYRNKGDTENKTLILKALGCLRRSDIIEQHFWNILSPIVANDHKLMALESLYSESYNNAIEVYKLITKNYRNISNVFGKETVVAEMISKISKNFSENSQKQDLINFTEMSEKIKCKAALKILESAIQTLNENRKCF